MKNILITGATGNIGIEVLQALENYQDKITTVAAVRNIEKAKNKLNQLDINPDFLKLDFNEPGKTETDKLSEIDSVFLLRPPEISDVNGKILPLLKLFKEAGINEIIFLSVQDAEKLKFIPHNKIERYISEMGFKSVFVRPSYFMQNLTGDLLADIKYRNSIVLPAGKSEFNWIDAKDIGEFIALIAKNFSTYENSVYTLTGTENKNFSQVAEELSEVLNRKIEYINKGIFAFYYYKRRKGIARDKIIVMTFLHYLNRFKKKPIILHDFEEITGKKSAGLKDFIYREKHLFEK